MSVITIFLFIKPLFIQINPAEVSDLFFEGGLARMAALQVSRLRGSNKLRTKTVTERLSILGKLK